MAVLIPRNHRRRRSRSYDRSSDRAEAREASGFVVVMLRSEGVLISGTWREVFRPRPLPLSSLFLPFKACGCYLLRLSCAPTSTD